MTRRCLIIDQSAMVRRVAARIIREFGFEILEAKTGQDALDTCSVTLPEVVLLDWKTSDMNGVEFMAQLRNLTQRDGTPMPTILFCTGERSVDTIVSALRAGADEYIMKPFDSDIIASKFTIAGLISQDQGQSGEPSACAVP